MKWIYKKEVNRMGEITQTLTNESIDMPVLDEYQTPTLIIKKDRFGFGIKFYLGGLEIKGGYKIERYYTRGCYNTYIEHKRLVDNGIRKYRFRFDEGQVEESNIDYFCKDESEFKIVSDFMFNLKESKRFIVELDTLTHGIQYYEFELEGLTELCDEHKMFQYKKPTPFEPYIPSTKKPDNGFYIWLIYGIIIFLSIFFIVYLNHKEEPIDTTTYNNDVYKPSPGAWDDLSTMEKKETLKKKVKVPKREKIIKEKYTYEEDEFVKPIESIEPTPTYSEKEKEMIRYLKSKFPNYSEEQIGKMVGSNKEYNNDIPTYVVSSVRHIKTENNDSNISTKNEDKLNVNDYPTYQVKKKGILKRLFSKN